MSATIVFRFVVKPAIVVSGSGDSGVNERSKPTFNLADGAGDGVAPVDAAPEGEGDADACGSPFADDIVVTAIAPAKRQ